MGRQPVFDPSRLDDELDELLPPPPVRLVQSPAETEPDAEGSVDALPADPSAELEHVPGPPASVGRLEDPTDHPMAGNSVEPIVAATDRRPRGSGGRPPAAASPTVDSPAAAPTPAGFSVVASRIPTPLWQAVIDGPLSGRERPSYAQLISWTCMDHPDEVVAQIRANLLPDRTPRGRRLAMPVNTITIRFRQDELAAFDGLIERASDSGQRVTRTAGIVAALQVALVHA